MRRAWLLIVLTGCPKQTAAPAVSNATQAEALPPPCAPELANVGGHAVRLPRAMADLVAAEARVELLSLDMTLFQEELSMIWMATVIDPTREFPGEYAAWIEASTGHAPTLDEDDPLMTQWLARWRDGDATFEVSAGHLQGSTRTLTITYQCWGAFPRPFTLHDVTAFPEDLSPAWMPAEIRVALDDRELVQVGVVERDGWEYALGMLADEPWLERWRATLLDAGYEESVEEDRTRYTRGDLAIELRRMGQGVRVGITRGGRATPPG